MKKELVKAKRLKIQGQRNSPLRKIPQKKRRNDNDPRSSPLLGAHISIAGGVDRALPRAHALGCTAIQIFTRNAAQWRTRPLLSKEIASFRSNQISLGIRRVMAHNSYLINLANPEKKSLTRSKEAFLDDMDRAEALEIPFLVMHPGAHLGAGEKEGLKRIAQSLNLLMEMRMHFQLLILLETTAGQGSILGYRFEQLAWIIEHTRYDHKIGVCFDTCHSFAAGYDLRIEDTFDRTFKDFDEIIGLDRIKAFHLNDSRGALGSRIDRHEHIGQGHLGLDPFRIIMKDPRFKEVPKVIETPKLKEGIEADPMNLHILHELARSA